MSAHLPPLSRGAPSPASDVAERLIGTLLPNGGRIVSLVEAHFDESIGEKGRNLLAVAGYLFTDRMARRLTREWAAVLRPHGIPYFRMSACAHRNKPFDGVSRDDCIAIETSMIEIVKRRAIQGFAVIVDLDEYEHFMPRHELIGSAYTFCAHVVIGGIAHWIERTGYKGEVAYMFEAGHRSQSEANKIMGKIFDDPRLRESQRYRTHAFVDKAKSPPTQAADMLAWHTYTDQRRQFERLPRRKDFAALLRPRDQAVHVTRERMSNLAEKWFNGESSLARLHLGDRGAVG